MKSSSYWCMACGLPELPILGLFKNKNQLKYMISQWGSSLPGAPISTGVSVSVNFIPVCRHERSRDISISSIYFKLLCHRFFVTFF